MTDRTVDSQPRIDVVGLGPAGPELLTEAARALLGGGRPVYLRTGRHPAAQSVSEARTFDHSYEEASSLDAVYRSIVEDLVAAARAEGAIVYAVPGSPSVAETTVTLLRGHGAVSSGEVALEVHASVSFLDLAVDRLGVDPLAAGVRLVDGEAFAAEAAGERGPLLVAQCWSRSVLSEIKLAVDAAPERPVTVLWHLGLADERVWDVGWDELDRAVEPDHLTSLWIPSLTSPVAVELVALDELVRSLRARCPWDRAQTHGSLARHLLEETHEVLDAIDELSRLDEGRPSTPDGRHAQPRSGSEREADAVAHLEEELGDLLFQVYFHADARRRGGSVHAGRCRAERPRQTGRARIRTCSATQGSAARTSSSRTGRRSRRRRSSGAA